MCREPADNQRPSTWCTRKLTRNSNLLFAAAYGVVLASCGFLVAGYGHGTYTLLALAGAPLSALGPLPATIAALVQWPLMVAANRRMPGIVRVFLFAHYAAAILLLTLPTSPYADWSYAATIPSPYRALLVAGFLWYVAGQVVLWKALLRPPGMTAYRG